MIVTPSGILILVRLSQNVTWMKTPEQANFSCEISPRSAPIKLFCEVSGLFAGFCVYYHPRGHKTVIFLRFLDVFSNFFINQSRCVSAAVSFNISFSSRVMLGNTIFTPRAYKRRISLKRFIISSCTTGLTAIGMPATV